MALSYRANPTQSEFCEMVTLSVSCERVSTCTQGSNLEESASGLMRGRGTIQDRRTGDVTASDALHRRRLPQWAASPSFIQSPDCPIPTTPRVFPSINQYLWPAAEALYAVMTYDNRLSHFLSHEFHDCSREEL